jgi:hypothetical protein
MADSKISALPASTTPLAGTEVLPIVQSSTTKQVSVANLTAGRDIAATSLTTAAVQATNSSGLTLKNSGGTTQLSLGAGSGNNITLSVATSISDNIIQGTAAKGVNFTANTAQAGMTSQLLNWYEEGTWTPAQGSGLVIVGTFSSSGYYTRVGRLVTINFTVAGSTSISVGAFGQITDNLPFTSGPLDTPATTLVGTTSNVTVIGANSKLVYAFSALSSDRFTISGTYRA